MAGAFLIALFVGGREHDLVIPTIVLGMHLAEIIPAIGFRRGFDRAVLAAVDRGCTNQRPVLGRDPDRAGLRQALVEGHRTLRRCGQLAGQVDSLAFVSIVQQLVCRRTAVDEFIADQQFGAQILGLPDGIDSGIRSERDLEALLDILDLNPALWPYRSAPSRGRYSRCGREPDR